MISRKILLMILLVFMCVVIPASSATEPVLVYSKELGVPITAVDNSGDGNLTFAGLVNGTIFCFDQLGNTIYVYHITSTNLDNSIRKIVADKLGNVIYLTGGSDTGLINPSGTLIKSYGGKSGWLTQDIDIAHDGSGQWWLVSNNTAMAYVNGTLGTSTDFTNLTPGTFKDVGFDYEQNLLITTNNTELFLWNMTKYIGWEEFNPSHTLQRNYTLLFLDSFPYRQNLSFNNGDVNLTTFRFIDNPAVSDISLNPNGTLYFNSAIHGKYFFWTYPGSINLTQPMLNYSYYNETLKQLVISTKPTTGGNNLTFYYGWKDFTNPINFTNITSSYFVFTNQTSWTAPANARYVYDIAVVGGGGAGNCPAYIYSRGGYGSVPAYGTYGSITPGQVFAFTIGKGGNNLAVGDCYADNEGQPGTETTAFGLTTSVHNRQAAFYKAGRDSQLVYTADFAAIPPGYFNYYSMNGTQGVGSTNYGAGGKGFGAGGGMGGTDGGWWGGNGSDGAVSFYYMTWEVFGSTIVDMDSPLLGAKQDIYVSTSVLNFVMSKDLQEWIHDVDVNPFWVSVATTTSQWNIHIVPYEFNATYVSFPTPYAPPTLPTMLSTSEGINTIEGSLNTIYEFIIYANTPNASSYYTGAQINSVDIAKSTGLWSLGGGNDGKMYILSKDEQSPWALYYKGKSGSSINSLSISDAGEFAGVGRASGRFEYYSVGGNGTGTVVPTKNDVSVDIFVSKGGQTYKNIPLVAIESNSGGPTGNISSMITDGNGKATFTAINGFMYNINVNAGEAIENYTASASYNYVVINIPVVLITNPFQYDSTINRTTGLITSTYTDVDIPINVNIRIVNAQNGTTLSNVDYPFIKNIVSSYTANKSDSYRVVFNITRFNGAKYSDTIYLNAGGFFSGISNISPQYQIFVYAVYIVMLMLISLSIGAASVKYGTVLLVALTALGLGMGFLPASLYTVAITFGCFIAMLTVFRRGG